MDIFSGAGQGIEKCVTIRAALSDPGLARVHWIPLIHNRDTEILFHGDLPWNNSTFLFTDVRLIPGPPWHRLLRCTSVVGAMMLFFRHAIPACPSDFGSHLNHRDIIYAAMLSWQCTTEPTLLYLYTCVLWALMELIDQMSIIHMGGCVGSVTSRTY